jgi:hypothetical protein
MLRTTSRLEVSSTMSVPPFPAALRERLTSFRERERELMLTEYKEASARVEFIDPLLSALGWDVSNAAGLPDRFKDVVVEPSQEVDGHKRAPDYALRIFGERKLFVEAKKPAVWIKSAPEPAYQARRYAWSAQLPIVVLTNFRELAIYDGRAKPTEQDPARKARVAYYKFTEFEERWEDLYSLLSKEAVDAGSLSQYTLELGTRSGSERIDRVFLRDLEDARSSLLTHVADRNPTLTDSELLHSIQLTLDRIVFLRICEDRGIEPFGTLRLAAEHAEPRKSLESLYRAADSRYNSGLFHFDQEPGRVSPDLLTPGLVIDDEIVRQTILRFYPPTSPYAFGVMPVEVLGKAYESFLSQRITRAGGKVALELKPEVRKAGGVYYTPEWLTAQVLDITLLPSLEGRTPAEIGTPKAPLRVLDPACGSGSFLVQAYRKLLDWHLSAYAADADKWLSNRNKRLERNKLGELTLTLAERKRILLTHIFGVDVDEQAVEVAKLSLLLTLMEDQDAGDVAQQLAVFKDRILPDLDRNIRWGNSLIAPDILTDAELADIYSPRRAMIQPFDWRELGQFAVIVGNPPWLMAGYEITADVLEYLKSKYDSYKGKADLYYLFIERSLSLLSDDGRLGLVVPNKMYSTGAAESLRRLLTQKPWLERLIDFQAAQLFEGATNYSQVLVVGKSSSASKTIVEYTRATPYMAATQSWSIDRARLGSSEWDLSSPEAAALWERITAGSTPLRGVASGFGNGVQTGKDPILILDREKASALKIEPRYLRPIVRGQDIRGGMVAASDKLVVFPYEERNGEFHVLTPSELARAPWLEAYLKQHEPVLRKRLWFGKSAIELTGQWWGLMYLDSAASFGSKHLITPSLSRRANFALGDGRLFPTGTAGATSVELPDGVDARPLLALLNSTLLSTYAMAHSPYYQGGFHKFSKRYIDGIPIRLAGDAASEKLWSRLAELWDSRAKVPVGFARELVDARIDDVVYELYGVDRDEMDPIVSQIESLTP